ncbi:hypothetical protein EK904_002175 [Melospiza melodia maxima]|nr:hypothetical protein EK904_002175 [Melospiza melodia maxima]
MIRQKWEKVNFSTPVYVTKSSFNKGCSKKSNTDFSEFKASLEEFLKWIKQKQDCKNVGRSEFGFYLVNRNLDGKCICPDPWKSHQALGKGRAAQALRAWLGRGGGHMAVKK